MGRLFWKFLFAFWAALIIIAIVVGSSVWLRNSSLNNNQHLDHHAEIFISPAAQVAEHRGIEALRQFLQDLEHAPGPMVYAINDTNHDLLERPIDSALLKRVRKRYEIRGNQATIRSVTTPDKQHFLLFAVLPQRVAPSYVSHPQSEEIAHHTMVPLHSRPGNRIPPRPRAFSAIGPPSLFALALLGLTASLIFSGLLAWYFTKPIRNLRNAFSAVAEGKLETRISDEMSGRKDELAELGSNFDDMVSNIATLISSKQQLLHDVSHELRSPLARMQAAIGIAQQQPEKSVETMLRLEQEIQRISNLIGELLLLSQVETTENSQQKQSLDLAEFMEELVDDACYEANEKNIIIDFDLCPQITILAYEELLRRAIENIIRNAIKFSPHNGHIQINVSHLERQLVISIKDQGPGVEEQYLNRIFTPFFRCNNKSNDSSGLGLAIASRAIQKHGGAITAHNRKEVGLEVEVTLPL
ncbi:MAG: two-component sensor histidine kinase [Gammaproteobacteria bacterium]|nr:MAG: two-component sensor histidine kinase [Gammaproteobacteria bacterium]